MPRVSSTASVRAHRARLANGQAIYRVVLPEVDLEALLEREGLLPCGEEHKHVEIEVALATFIGLLAKWSEE